MAVFKLAVGESETHIHDHYSETTLLDGSAELRMGSKVEKLTKDKAVPIPLNTEHTVTNTGKSSVSFGCIC